MSEITDAEYQQFVRERPFVVYRLNNMDRFRGRFRSDYMGRYPTFEEARDSMPESVRQSLRRFKDGWAGENFYAVWTIRDEREAADD